MITSLVLRNFKCFESQLLKIGTLTLLAGVNGMGKSSALQALLLIRQSYLDGVLPKTGLELNGSLVQMGTAQDVLYEDAQSDEFEIGIEWSDGVSANFILQYHREADVIKIDPVSIDQKIFTRIPFTDNFHYLQAERLGPRTTNSISDFQVREHRQIGSAGQYAAHFLHVYGTETVPDLGLRHSTSASTDLQSQVQAWLQDISPGTELHLSMHPEMDVINLRFSFITGKQRSNKYRATSVGFGITYVLPILVAILSSAPGSIIFVENPEAHLHPRGQVRMGILLAKAAAAGIQIIAETHSDHILNGVRIAAHDAIIQTSLVAIHYFSRTEFADRVRSKVQSPILDSNGRLNEWPEGFFDEWDKTLQELLKPRR